MLNDGRVGKINDDQKELLDSIEDDSERLLKITGELLNMTQLETGKIQLKVLSTSPKLIVDQALQAVQFQANQRNIILNLKLDPILPNILADAEKSTWVLMNFLTNAIKFSSEKNEIDISVSKKADTVVFTVLRIMVRVLMKDIYLKYLTGILKCPEHMKGMAAASVLLFRKNLLRHRRAKYGFRVRLEQEVRLVSVLR